MGGGVEGDVGVKVDEVFPIVCRLVEVGVSGFCLSEFGAKVLEGGGGSG